MLLGLIILCGLLSIVYGVYTIRSVMSADAGSQRMQEISGAVREGAQAYLKRQYTTIAGVGVVVFIVLGLLLSWTVAVGFAIGAILSGSAGFIGMNVSVRANVRTAQAATKSLAGGLDIAFRSGAVTGLLVAGLALLGVSGYFTVLTHVLGHGPADRITIDALVALGFGASLISIFARLGGGIFTKGADVGADLVGKVEAGIPEDDPRNPATIADNVGDNVGDCAGMAADLFETYAVTVVATMVLASIFFEGTNALLPTMMYPLAICAACIVTSIIGTFFVKLGANNSIMGALYKGLIATGVLSIVGLAVATTYVVGWGEVGTVAGKPVVGVNLFVCGLVGLVVTGLIVVITEYYTGTGKRPVVSIAQASVTGHGTNVIQGLAVSLEIDGASGAGHRRRHHCELPARRPVRHRDRGHDHARPRRHDRRARRLRSGHRQRRRHRRNGGPAEGSAPVDRRARRGRQHDQGGHQGLRDRLGGSRRAGAVRRLHQRHQAFLRDRRALLQGRRRRRFRPLQPLCRRRPDLRRPDPLPVRRHRHDRGRPGGGVGGARSAPPVQGNARHHEGHAAPRLRPRGRHADQGRDPGNDRALAPAGARALRRLFRRAVRSRARRPRPSRRSAPRCSA